MPAVLKSPSNSFNLTRSSPELARSNSSTGLNSAWMIEIKVPIKRFCTFTISARQWAPQMRMQQSHSLPLQQNHQTPVKTPCMSSRVWECLPHTCARGTEVDSCSLLCEIDFHCWKQIYMLALSLSEECDWNIGALLQMLPRQYWLQKVVFAWARSRH